MNTNKLKEVRKKRGMSISELSRRTNISRVTITRLENGEETNPKLKTVSVISKALGKDPKEIFF